jgi:acetolactate synthase-1/2/3 large subunit
MLVSDYIAKELSKHCRYAFIGHGSSIIRLLDSLRKIKKIKLIPSQNEQGASIAADAYSRVSKKIGLVITTSGPGTINALQGLASSYYDSIPAIYISGAPSTKLLRKKNSKMRQLGFQEMNMTDITKSFCKYAVRIKNANQIPREISKCLYIAKKDRPGPCLIEIPEDIQRSKLIKLKKKFKIKINKIIVKENKINKFLNLIKNSKKPLILAGSGIKTSGCQLQLKQFIEKYKIPYCLSWGAFDVLENKKELNIGSIGVYASRHGNKIVQECDLLIILGCRLNPTLTGNNLKNFSSFSKKIKIDIDPFEFSKESKIKYNLNIKSDLKIFLEIINKKKIKINIDKEWYRFINENIKKYPTVKKEYYQEKNYVNPYVFFRKLSKHIPQSSIIINDTSNNFVWFYQSFIIKNKINIFSSYNHSPMGYSVCASIGAYFASKNNKIFSIIGDGGMQMNIQELENIKNFKIPTKIILIENNILGMVAQATDTWFKSKYVGCDKKSGLSFPNFSHVFKSYGIDSIEITNNKEIDLKLKKFVLNKNAKLCIVKVDPKSKVSPKVRFGGDISSME